MRHEYDREETSATTKLTYLLIGGGIGAALLEDGRVRRAYLGIAGATANFVVQ